MERYRSDKSTSNSLKVARNIMKTIEDPVKEDELRSFCDRQRAVLLEKRRVRHEEETKKNALGAI